MNEKEKLAIEVCQSSKVNETRLDIIFMKMWRNTRIDGGMRLTKTGFDWLKLLGKENNKLKIPKHIIQTGNILLGLDRILQAPYYFDKVGTLSNELYVFDSNFSTQLTLYDGDLKLFIEANSEF